MISSDTAFFILLVCAALLFVYLLSRGISRVETLRWEDLVSTRDSAGKYWLNAYKIGYWLGACGGFWVIVQQATTAGGKVDPVIFGAWLTFLGGVSVMQSRTRMMGGDFDSGTNSRGGFSRFDRPERPADGRKDLPPVPPPKERNQ